MTTPLKVFVSSTYFDNLERRERVREVIQRAGYLPVGMETWSAASTPVVDECLAKVRASDVFVLILAHRYGFEPAGVGRSITELEHDEGEKRGLARLVFLIADDVPVVPARHFDAGPERWEKQKKLEAFKSRLSSDPKIVVRPFDDDNLPTLVLQALYEHAEKAKQTAGAQARAAQPRTRAPKATTKRRATGEPSEAEVRAYLEQLTAEHEKIALAGFETKVRVPIRLEDLYVPLEASVDLRLAGGREFGDAAESEELLRGQSAEVPLAEAFGRASYLGRKGIVLLGDPGSGKTTQLKRMLLSMARHGPSSVDLPEGSVPVFVPLRELGEVGGDLQRLVRRRLEACEVRTSKGFAERLLRRGNLAFLIDGLDEVSDTDDRQRVSRAIEKLLVTHPESRVAVTCRFAGYKGKAQLGADFLELHLHRFTRAQSEEFIQRWFELVETSLASDVIAARREARRKADELVAHLRAPEFRAQRVLEMTRNPLLLTAICLVHRDRRLPEKRVALYDECVKVLLELWRGKRGPAAGLDAEGARRVLQPVALFLHEGEKTRATAAELAPVLDRALQAVGWKAGDGAAFLAAVRDESGLLTGLSGDLWSFMHLGFQEYLTAREIRARAFQALAEGKTSPAETELGKLVGRFGESWWQEATLLLLSLEEPSVAELFWRELLGREDFPAQSQFLDLCLTEPAHVPLTPFLDFLTEKSADRARLERMQACLRVLHLRRVELPAALRKRLAAHSDARVAGFVQRTWAASGVLETRAEVGGRFVVTRKSARGDVPLIEIPGGESWMGSSDEELARAKKDFPEVPSGVWQRERPRHRVTLAPFALALTPVTNAQYARFLADSPGAAEPKFWSDRHFNQPEQPVVGVSWDEANAFCRWAGLRLPSEAEWEHACRASSPHERYESGPGESDLARVGWYAKNSKGELHPVGEKPANGFGLHDMHGNVWEWCEDTWHENYKGAPTDGSPWVEEASEYRVLRGGSFENSAVFARSASRSGNHPSDRGRHAGFRPARSVTTD